MFLGEVVFWSQERGALESALQEMFEHLGRMTSWGELVGTKLLCQKGVKIDATAIMNGVSWYIYHMAGWWGGGVMMRMMMRRRRRIGIVLFRKTPAYIRNDSSMKRIWRSDWCTKSTRWYEGRAMGRATPRSTCKREFSVLSEHSRFVNYCWWKKSCTTWDV